MSSELKQNQIVKQDQSSHVKIPKATHSGVLTIGNSKIPCSVLEDGRRVVTLSGMNNALGRKSKRSSPTNSEGALILPNFLSPENIRPFISEDLKKLCVPILFSKSGGKAYGFEADIFPMVCSVYLEARDNGALLTTQKFVAKKCDLLIRALAHVGITALIDESTGFQRDREQDALQSLFSKFIAKELQPWVKRFPDQFFHHLKRIYGLEHMKGNPKFFGCLINKWIYKQLSPDILEELKRKNPVQESGVRKHQHHLFLTTDIGCPALEKQIFKVTTLLSVSDSKEQVEFLMDKSMTSK